MVLAVNAGSAASAARIFMVGAFPPPVHGMAVINQAAHDQFASAIAAPVRINISAPDLDRSIGARLLRLPRIIRGLLRLALHGRARTTLYMSVSGGFGQVYEIMFLLIARLRGMRIFLHHHCFAYIYERQPVTRMLTRVAGAEVTHIVLSDGMGEGLARQYPGVRRVRPVSNTVFLAGGMTYKPLQRHRLARIGFISNIAEEKGIFDFLDLAAEMQRLGLPLTAAIAGPFQDGRVEAAVRDRLTAIDNTEYVGPKYGTEKDEFFSGIDALIFPTRYLNEAEPLVILEALAHGVPVIAFGRGAIPEILEEGSGLVVDPSEAFLPLAIGRLREWLDDPRGYADASRLATQRYARILELNRNRWQGLLADMTSPKAGP